MLLRESENLRFNLVSSCPCQVSPAETGPKCPTVYLGVRRFGSHGSAPGWLPQRCAHSNEHRQPPGPPKYTAPATGSAPDLCKHLPSPPRALPSRPPCPLLPVPVFVAAGDNRGETRCLQPLLSRALHHGDAEGMKWGGRKEAAERLQGCWEGKVGPAASSYSQPWHHLGCASNTDLARGTGGNTHCTVSKRESRPRVMFHIISNQNKSSLSLFHIRAG